MTVIAAIYPAEGLPLFLCDTLISIESEPRGHVAGPAGLITPPPPGSKYKPVALQQKTIILRPTVFLAYCGKTLIGTIIFRRVDKALAGIDAPTLAQVAAILEESVEDLQQHDTAILGAVIEDGKCFHLSYGTGFQDVTLEDGTTLIVNGSGSSALLDLFEVCWAGKFASMTADHLPHHRDVFRAFAMVSEVSSYESIMAEHKADFGAIVEILRATTIGFEKLPSATIVTELISFQPDQMTVHAGNYLNYVNDGDLIVYRRFGDIRREKMTEIFGTDYIAGTINPPTRSVSKSEETDAVERLISRAEFNDSVIQAISWSNPSDLPNRRLTLGEPNWADFRIARDGDHFSVFRSHAFMEKLAKRFGVSKVIRLP